MLDVAIIGAGELGGAIAHLLARSDTASSIRLVDDMGTVAAGKALDIMQAGAVEAFSTRVSGTSDLFTIGGASVLVLADRAGQTGPPAEWQGDEGLQQLARVMAIARDRIVLCAGASQRDLVERGVRELGISRDRIVGSAAEALVGALKACVAVEADTSPLHVGLTLLGVPPDQVVVPWEEATIAGRALTRVLDEPAKRRLMARVTPLWPPGPHALAAAAVRALSCVEERSRGEVCCFVAADDSAGLRTRAVALPSRLGRQGLVAAPVPALNGNDRVAFDNARLL